TLANVQQDDKGVVCVKEQTILEVDTLLANTEQAAGLRGLLKFVRPFLISISKAKAEIKLCLECIEWAKSRRSWIKKLYLWRFNCLKVKPIMHLGKARAALTSARTIANAIYCPPKLQTALDMQSDIIHAAERKDWKTVYFCFFEAFEVYDFIDSPGPIMLNLPEEVQAWISGKLALLYAGGQTDALKCVAQANKNRSLANFQKQNLIRVIEPFSRVQITHTSGLIKLSKGDVERTFILIIFEEPLVDKTYEAAIKTIQNMSKVVYSVEKKIKKITELKGNRQGGGGL
uniref:Proteasome 26S subunit, non-ATPase 11b n=1 Tax=Astyanax mexicanus TaxID=7994 RepID=A0A3B1J481_ASTMX